MRGVGRGENAKRTAVVKNGVTKTRRPKKRFGYSGASTTTLSEHRFPSIMMTTKQGIVEHVQMQMQTGQDRTGQEMHSIVHVDASVRPVSQSQTQTHT